MSDRRAYAYGLAAATLVLAVAAAAVDLFVADAHAEGWALRIVAPLLCLSPAAFGLVVLRRQPGNRVGWLLVVQGASLAFVFVVDRIAYAGLDDPDFPLWEWFVLLNDVVWALMFAPLIAIAFVFPDGRLLPGRGWKLAARFGLVALPMFMLGAASGDRPFEADWAAVEQPMPDALAPLMWLMVPGMLGGFVAVVAAVLAVRSRFKASTGVERQQLRWLAAASLLIPTALAIGFIAGALGASDEAGGIAAVAAGVAIPAAIAVAITRYRLYELDHLVNRTVVYVLLTVLLGGAYAAVSLAAGLMAGDDGRLATAAATLAVALAFRPLRARVQRAVDSRFDRARYEVLLRLEAFNARVREGTAAPEDVGRVLADSLADPTLEVLFWLPESQVHVDAAGRPREVETGPGCECTPVRRGTLDLGVVLYARTERTETVRAAVSAAGLAIEIARLRVEVRRQLDEVAASRARIVAAADAERRRLERDLHDGAQQRLVSIGLALRHVQHDLPPDASGARADLDGAVAELAGAIGDLRELSQGLRPAHLDAGLTDALEELARRAPLPVSVDATPGEIPDGIETAAYFVACEALTNAIKHAGASAVEIQVGREDGGLRLHVADDGVGGARAGGGSGLVGMSDRVAAEGGTLRIVSRPGEGTTVTAELPCGS